MLCFVLCCACCAFCRAEVMVHTKPVDDEMYELLQTWCDGLLDFQIRHESLALDGGIICPACAFMHGRASDAVYPLFFIGTFTGDKKYIDAAVRLFNWGKNNVRFFDGSWSNEVNLSDWRGTTVFGLIALAESFRDFSYLMEVKTKADWLCCVKEQADFISYYVKPGIGSINYSASACYALALASEVTGVQCYKERAAELADSVLNYFTPNEFFVYGEGEYPYALSSQGLLPIDLGYNVEETLPNLLLYAELVGNDELKDLVKRSMKTHIEFLLPDGAWDNSWGTRNFKWSYWGSRTSDGVLPLCALLAREDSVYAEIGYRNFELLKECTVDKFLLGGCHYKSAGYAACVHHTFEHAKSLAMALKLGFRMPPKRILIPREKEYGVKHFKDANLWTVSCKGWVATVSGYDVDYKMLGGNPHGGTLSLLWHEEAGPLLASGMMSYSCVEPANMQMSKGQFNYPSNLEIRYEEDGVVYRSVSFRDVDISHETIGNKELILVKTALETMDYQQLKSVEIRVNVRYEFKEDELSVCVDVLPPNETLEMSLFVPIISQAKEMYVSAANECYIYKAVNVNLSSDHKIKILPVESNGRAFCPVPGFEFIPFEISFQDEVRVVLSCH